MWDRAQSEESTLTPTMHAQALTECLHKHSQKVCAFYNYTPLQRQFRTHSPNDLMFDCSVVPSSSPANASLTSSGSLGMTKLVKPMALSTCTTLLLLPPSTVAWNCCGANSCWKRLCHGMFTFGGDGRDARKGQAEACCCSCCCPSLLLPLLVSGGVASLGRSTVSSALMVAAAEDEEGEQ